MTGAWAGTPHHGLPRVLAGLEPGIEWLSLADHEAIHGPLRHHPGAELIEMAARSGLRGRGGADFPTARKLQAVAAGHRVSAVVANGSETEPGSAKDAMLLGRLPHLVLDGAVLAAEAVGAPGVIVRLREGAARELATLEQAIGERRDRVPIRVAVGAPGYVTGEESALIHELNGGRAVPTFVPPRPFQRGYRGRPTLVQNVETLAQLALIARFGSTWFRELGTAADPGTALVTISGAVVAPGVYELAFGTPMRDLLAAAGGATEPLQALLVGGYFGTWVQAEPALELRLAREDLRSVGCALGAGVLIALGVGSCGLSESARVIDYLARQSSGQCGPCVFGLRAIADGVAALAAGRATVAETRRVRARAAEVRGRGACHHPDGAVRFVQSALSVFAQEIERHLQGRCGGRPADLPLGPEAEGVGRRYR